MQITIAYCYQCLCLLVNVYDNLMSMLDRESAVPVAIAVIALWNLRNTNIYVKHAAR